MLTTNLTTGVLIRGATTIFEGARLANIDPTETLQVSVFAFDWTSGSPVALTLFTAPLVPVVNPISLAPNTSQFIFTADLSVLGVSSYEIRFVYPSDSDLVFNCYGLTALPPLLAIGLENIVLHSQLKNVELV